MAGKRHFTNGGPQTSIASIVVGQQQALLAQIIHSLNQMNEVLGIVQIGHIATGLVQHLGQDARAHAVLAFAQVHQNQAGVLLCIELRRQAAAHIVNGREGGDDQTHRRGDLLVLTLVLPAGFHRQAVFAHWNGDAQRWTQSHAHGLHRVKQSRVFAGLAASSHPIGRQLQLAQLDGCRQDIGDRFSHRHATRCRRIQGSQGCAFAQAHGLTSHAFEIGQRDRAIGHRHLPRTDHLITVAQSANCAVADRDEKAFAGHRGVAQYLNHGVLQSHIAQVQRR